MFEVFVDGKTSRYSAKPIMDVNVSGSSFRNDMTDIPFGETYIDTLTWDDNTEGLVGVDGLMMYKISDTIPSFEDVSKGGTLTMYTEGGPPVPITILDTLEELDNGAWAIVDRTVMGIPEAAVGVDYGDGFMFSESGLYAMIAPTLSMSLQINGYTGFPGVKPIDTKYLPEHLQFGEKEVIEVAWNGGEFETVKGDYPHDNAQTGISDPDLHDRGTGAFKIDQIYTVKFDGKEYECKYQRGNIGTFFYIFGNASLYRDSLSSGSGLEINDEPFALVFDMSSYGFGWFLITKEAGMHTISIYGDSTVTVPLDEKYMPTLTSPNGTVYRIAVSDDGTLTTVTV